MVARAGAAAVPSPNRGRSGGSFSVRSPDAAQNCIVGHGMARHGLGARGNAAGRAVPRDNDACLWVA